MLLQTAMESPSKLNAFIAKVLREVQQFGENKTSI